MTSAIVFAALLVGQQAGAPIERRAPYVPQGQRQESVPTLKVESRLVSVAVNVNDGTGAPVGGLGKDDFEILEDGKVQPIAVFERESATPLSVVMAVDTSESVITEAKMLREAAKKFVHLLLRAQDEMDLVQFSDTVKEVVPFTNNERRLEAGLGSLERGDATALYDAIYLSSQRLQETRNDAGRRRVIVLVTDGGDTVKGVKYTEALEEAQRAGAMVYCLIVVPIWADAGRNTGGEHALIQLAEDTGGKYFYVKDPKQLEPALAHVSDDLRTQYVVGYYSPRKVDGGFRKIKVRMKDESLREKDLVRTRSGYYAKGDGPKE